MVSLGLQPVFTTSTSSVFINCQGENVSVASGSSNTSTATPEETSIANVLDEGLGTSLDGTEDMSSNILASGRTDSGVFSGDETPSPTSQGSHQGCEAKTLVEMTGNSCSTDSSESSKTWNSSTAKHKQPRSKTTSPSRQGPQRCLVCGKVFSNASALTKHKLTHSDERKHACSICGKAFKRQDHLNGHLLTHRNKKPFECRAKGCGKSYCDGRSLRRHIESRHGAEALAILPIQSSSPKASPVASAGGGKCANNNNNNCANNNNNKNLSCNYGNGTADISSSEDSCKEAFLKSPPAEESKCVVNGCSAGGEVLKPEGVVGLPTTPTTLGATAPSPPVIPVTSAMLNSSTLKIVEPIHFPDGTTKIVGLTLTGANGIPTLCSLVSGSSKIPIVTSSSTSAISSSMPITIRATQSQLQQLLSQRGLAGSEVIGFTTAPMSFVNGAKTLTVVQPKVEQVPTTEVKVEPGKVSVRPASAPTSGLLSAKSSSSSSQPTSLEEQIELIHQIIQQAQEESNLAAAAAAAAAAAEAVNGKSSKGGGTSSTARKTTLKAPSTPSSKQPTEASKLTGESDSELIKSSNDKPVECTICCRRFKNTPALNGHMRLHGGYFKKDSDTRKRDNVVVTSTNAGGKEMSALQTPPLQTVSVSVRALIEEKIHQKRSSQIQGQLQASKAQANGGANPQQPITTTTSTNPTSANNILTQAVNATFLDKSPSNETFGLALTSCSVAGNDVVAAPTETTSSVSSLQQHQQDMVNFSSTFTTSASLSESTTTTTTTTSSANSAAAAAAALQQFVCGDENSDYLLMEEEVFNKVSSMCPDAFLNGLEESLLNSTSDASIPAEWQWTMSEGLTDSSSSRHDDPSLFLNSAETPATATDVNSQGALGAATPVLPSSFTSPCLDPNGAAAITKCFSAATTGPHSPCLNSQQDSPSSNFIYPTPPASLESHNALQSPLFPFPSNNSSAVTTTTSALPGGGILFPSSLDLPALIPSQLMITSSCVSNNSNSNATSINNDNSNDHEIDFDHSDFHAIIGDCSSSHSSSHGDDGAHDDLVKELLMCGGGGDHHHHQEALQSLQQYTCSEPEPSLIKVRICEYEPPTEPEAAGAEISSFKTEELKINDPMDLQQQDKSKTSPNRLKRKLNGNATFASNLRPREGAEGLQGGGPEGPLQGVHYTPYPMLNPVRSSSGLYWPMTPGGLSFLEGVGAKAPTVNVGPEFQAVVPEYSPPAKKKRLEVDDGEEQDCPLWIPDGFGGNDELDEVENFLEFACCSAIPGGGRNKEYALHVLNYCKGNIMEAMAVLMNDTDGSNLLPAHIKDYKYAEMDKWSGEEVSRFQAGLLKHGKDFVRVASEVGSSKTSLQCVVFYYLWKKTCSADYTRLRSVWKKRDSIFTVELLKSTGRESIIDNDDKDDDKYNNHNNNISQNPAQVNQMSLVSANEAPPEAPPLPVTPIEFPCKVCGKVFSKVKSRSAHMKSHRPPEAVAESKKAKAANSKKKKEAEAMVNLEENVNVGESKTTSSATLETIATKAATLTVADVDGGS